MRLKRVFLAVLGVFAVFAAFLCAAMVILSRGAMSESCGWDDDFDDFPDDGQAVRQGVVS